MATGFCPLLKQPTSQETGDMTGVMNILVVKGFYAQSIRLLTYWDQPCCTKYLGTQLGVTREKEK